MAQKPVALSVSQLTKVLEGFIGVKLSPATINLWIGAGDFPNARKQTPRANGRWVIPIGDVVAYVKRAYPKGPITDDVDEDVKAAFNHIVALAYPVPSPS